MVKVRRRDANGHPRPMGQGQSSQSSQSLLAADAGIQKGATSPWVPRQLCALALHYAQEDGKEMWPTARWISHLSYKMSVTLGHWLHTVVAEMVACCMPLGGCSSLWGTGRLVGSVTHVYARV